MKIGFKNSEVITWEYTPSNQNDLTGFLVKSKETVEPHISKITVVEDMFILSLLWQIELNYGSYLIPQLLFRLNTDHYFSNENSIQDAASVLIVEHSFEIVNRIVDPRKVLTIEEYGAGQEVAKIGN